MNFKKQKAKKDVADFAREEMQANKQVISEPPEMFEPDPEQPRKTINKESIDSLRERIEMEGQLQAIVVKPRKSNTEKYQIISGERRWRAISSSKKVKVVEAIIRTAEKEDDFKANLEELYKEQGIEVDVTEKLMTKVTQISENREREDVSIIEEAQSYQDVIDELGEGSGVKRTAAKIIGISESNLNKYLKLLEADPKVVELIDSGDCDDLETLYTANTLMKNDPEAGSRLIDEWGDLREEGHNMRQLVYGANREARENKKAKDSKSSKSSSSKKSSSSTTRFSGFKIDNVGDNFELSFKLGKAGQKGVLTKEEFLALAEEVAKAREGINV